MAAVKIQRFYRRHRMPKQKLMRLQKLMGRARDRAKMNKGAHLVARASPPA